MPAGPTTPDRILESARVLFNQKGYSATPLAEIASSIGIAQGNLTYHFPTKRKLALEIEKRLRTQVRAERAGFPDNPDIDDYLDLFLTEMELTWEHRFLLRDRAQLARASRSQRRDPDMAANFERLHELLEHMQKQEMFRQDLGLDLKALARSIWIVGRYWADHLAEIEGIEEASLVDRERGLQNYFAVLYPCLTAPARRHLESSMARASMRIIQKTEESMLA